MNIVLWIANDSNQKALANKIHASFPLAGIVTESRKHTTKITLAKLFEKIVEKLFLPSIGASWWGMKRKYDKTYPTYPSVKTIDVENINSPNAFEFTTRLSPDLIIVSGTRLVKEKMLSINPTIGSINLHTGLSPYIKGGPNCTNWCIATGQFHLIGNTIMWIDEGIDSGNIVTTQHTTFSGDEDLLAVHTKVMEHAHQLYVNAITALAKGLRTSIKQNSIANGKTYYSKQWGLKEKILLVKNFKLFKQKINSSEVNRLKLDVITVDV